MLSWEAEEIESGAGRKQELRQGRNYACIISECFSSDEGALLVPWKGLDRADSSRSLPRFSPPLASAPSAVPACRCPPWFFPSLGVPHLVNPESIPSPQLRQLCLQRPESGRTSRSLVSLLSHYLLRSSSPLCETYILSIVFFHSADLVRHPSQQGRGNISVSLISLSLDLELAFSKYAINTCLNQ